MQSRLGDLENDQSDSWVWSRRFEDEVCKSKHEKIKSPNSLIQRKDATLKRSEQKTDVWFFVRQKTAAHQILPSYQTSPSWGTFTLSEFLPVSLLTSFSVLIFQHELFSSIETLNISAFLCFNSKQQQLQILLLPPNIWKHFLNLVFSAKFLHQVAVFDVKRSQNKIIHFRSKCVQTTWSRLHFIY